MSKQNQIALDMVQRLCMNERLLNSQQNFVSLQNDFDDVRNAEYYEEEPIALPMIKLADLEHDISKLAKDLEQLAYIMEDDHWSIVFGRTESEIVKQTLSNFSDRMEMNEICIENIEWFLNTTLFVLTHSNIDSDNYVSC